MKTAEQQEIKRNTREAGRAASSQLTVVIDGARYDVSAVPGIERGTFLHLRVPHIADRNDPAKNIHVVLGDGSYLSCPRVAFISAGDSSCHAH